MEERSLMEFRKCTSLYNEVDSKLKKTILLFLGNIIITCLLLYWLYAENLLNEDGGKTLFVLFLICGVVSVVSTYRSLTNLSTFSTNLNKNKLEIKNTYVSGIYTEDPKSSTGEKYFKIPYGEIEKIEVTETNIKMGSLHNFTIYHSGGLVKLAIDLPTKAKDMIYEKLESNKMAGQKSQAWKCPKCEKAIVSGQAMCENCGQMFDWSKM